LLLLEGADVAAVAAWGVRNADEVVGSELTTLVGGSPEGVALIYGRAARAEGVGLGGTAVVLERAEEGVG
jgi:hypothetical protein